MRIAAADHAGLTGQRAGEGAEAVVEQQHPRAGCQALRVQVLEQVLVGGIEGLQRLGVLLGLTDQVELGEGRGEGGHRRIAGAGGWAGHSTCKRRRSMRPAALSAL